MPETTEYANPYEAEQARLQNALYGGGPKTPEKRATVDHSSEDFQHLLRNSPDPELVKRMYPEFKPEADTDADTPANIQELRSKDPAHQMYGVSGLQNLEFERVFGDDVGRGVRYMAADMGMEESHATKLLAAVSRQKAGTAEGSEVQRNKAVAALRAAYGDKAEEMAGLADRLVNRDPRVRALIAKFGIGNDPDLVVAAVELAQRERSRGRL